MLKERKDRKISWKHVLDIDTPWCWKRLPLLSFIAMEYYYYVKCNKHRKPSNRDKLLCRAKKNMNTLKLAKANKTIFMSLENYNFKMEANFFLLRFALIPWWVSKSFHSNFMKYSHEKISSYSFSLLIVGINCSKFSSFNVL